VKYLLERTCCVSGAVQRQSVHVIIALGSMLWVQLFHAAGASVHVVDPKQARRFGESLCSSQAKDAARDARTLAELGRSHAHRPCSVQTLVMVC